MIFAKPCRQFDMVIFSNEIISSIDFWQSLFNGYDEIKFITFLFNMQTRLILNNDRLDENIE